jgi:hypothetical protein
MANTTLSAIHPTLLDFTKRLDPNGKIDQIAEVLNNTNEIIHDMVWLEANGVTGHRTTIRTGLPAPTWRKLYGGVQPTKSTTAQVTDSMGMLEAYAEVDKKLCEINGNTAAFRFSEELAHIEGMNQEMASTLIYGSESTAPEEFTGLAARFNDQSAANGDNILTSAATPDNTDNTSIWLIVWGANTVHGIFPKGSKAGLSVQDLGEVTAENIDGSNGRAQIYRSHYQWDMGLCVRDWRYIVRINYDLEDIVASGATGPVLYDLMRKAVRRIPNLSAGRPAFYMNRDSLDAFDLQANYKGNNMGFQTIEDAQGKLVNTFLKIPVRRVDAILSNESGL